MPTCRPRLAAKWARWTTSSNYKVLARVNRARQKIMANSGPTLAVLVKKWLKNYSTKSQWDFGFGYDSEKKEQDLNVGYLTLWRFKTESIGLKPVIKIEDDTAVIGEFGSASWERETWRESIYSGVKLIAADPRFFAKLDRAMQFLTRAGQRRSENEKKFAQAEMALLKDVLG